jgi:hypothetical protein
LDLPVSVGLFEGARYNLGDGRFESGAVADDAAVGPFQPHVARCDVRLAQHDDLAAETVFVRDALHDGVGVLDQRFVDAHHEMRHAAQLPEAVAGRLFEEIEREARQGITGDLAGEQKREVGDLVLGFGGSLGLAGQQRLRQPDELLAGLRQSCGGRIGGKPLAVGETARIAGLLGLGGGGLLAAKDAAAEIAVEEKFAGFRHDQ